MSFTTVLYNVEISSRSHPAGSQGFYPDPKRWSRPVKRWKSLQLMSLAFCIQAYTA